MGKEAITIGAVKTLHTTISFTRDVDGVSSQIVASNPAANTTIAQFTRRDFGTTLRKVNQRPNIPIGEHIREAVRVMKNNKH